MPLIDDAIYADMLMRCRCYVTAMLRDAPHAEYRHAYIERYDAER